MKQVYTLKQRNNIVLVLTLILGAGLLYALSDLFSAFLGAIVLYTIFRPLNIYLVKKRKINNKAASLLVLLVSFAAVVLPILSLILMMVNKVGEYTQNPAELEVLYNNFNKYASDYLGQPTLLKDLFEKTQSFLVGLFSSAIGSTLNALLQIAIMYFVLYFMFAEQENFEKGLLQYLPFKQSNSIKFGEELRNMTYSNILGQGFISIIQGILLSLGFLIFGFNDAFFWGVVTIFLSFVPILGAPLVFVPAALWAFASGDNVGGAGMLVYGFVLITNIDNVIRFIIAKKLTDSHPLISIIGVIVGIPIFGILGLVFGPLLFSFFILLVKIYLSNRKELLEINRKTNTEINHEG